MGGGVEKQIQKALGQHFHSVAVREIDAALAKADFFFAGAPAIENRIEQKIQNTKVASAKVAFDTVQDRGELLPIGGGRTKMHLLVRMSTILAQTSPDPGKLNFCTGTGRKAFFEFFRPDSGPPPPRYICFYSEKRQIHLYRPFFSPWHGLFRKKGGDWCRYTFLFSLLTRRVLEKLCTKEFGLIFWSLQMCQEYESSPYKRTFPDHRPQEETLEIPRCERKFRERWPKSS